MKTFTSEPSNHLDHHSQTATSMADEALGWEGHVNVPSSQIFAKLLNNWPELRTGLAFSLVFVAGTVVGGTLIALFGCNKQKSA